MSFGTLYWFRFFSRPAGLPVLFDIKEKQTIADEKDTLYKGVDLLLSNKQDQAIDAFINLVKLDPDTVEMHFSLAGLFRRRGEFDRAIKIHNVLVNREDLPKKDSLQSAL